MAHQRVYRTSLPQRLILKLLRLLRNHIRNPPRLLRHAPRLLRQPILPRLILFITHLKLLQPSLALLLAVRLGLHLLVVFSLDAVFLPVQVAHDENGDCEGLGVEAAAEVEVGHFVVAFAHAAGRADNGPHGEAAAKGDQGFFAEAAPYFVDCVFVVKVADQN
jgi:hypothetical protein